jgi:hypothetical protein
MPLLIKGNIMNIKKEDTLLENIVDSNGNPIADFKINNLVSIHQTKKGLCELTFTNGMAYTERSLLSFIAHTAICIMQDDPSKLVLLSKA